MKYCFLLVLLSTTVMANKEALEGVLLYEYGDAADGQSHQRFYLQTNLAKIQLSSSDAFASRIPIHLWSGKKVSVFFKDVVAVDGVRAIQAIELIEGAVEKAGISGPQKWVSLACKFNDVSDEPRNEAFFDGMYANSAGGLDDYWREVSYGVANVAGSVAFDWVTLPSNQTTYIPSPGNDFDADLDLLFDDCTEAAINAHPALDINDNFVGINMMFNASLDCCAWGGGKYTGLDGGSPKLWRVTWNPPWAFANAAVIAHEMGHGFGLPHANNSDGDDDPYDNPWDVMSAAQSYAVTNGVYGRLGKHINMYYKYILGWVDDSDGLVAVAFSDQTRVVTDTALGSTSNLRFARIPLYDGTQYFVETRKKHGVYEANIVASAVIIHHVDGSRTEPPWVVDKDLPAADFSDNEGTMWKVGETFHDPKDGASVRVLSSTSYGYRLQIKGSDVIFRAAF